MFCEFDSAATSFRTNVLMTRGKLGGFAYKEASGIESLLEKPAHEITLEKVLDEEDLLQEIKVHNARLLDYLRQEIVLSRLLELIIDDQHEDEKKGFK